jgi:hypothetical protein
MFIIIFYFMLRGTRKKRRERGASRLSLAHSRKSSLLAAWLLRLLAEGRRRDFFPQVSGDEKN